MSAFELSVRVRVHPCRRRTAHAGPPPHQAPLTLEELKLETEGLARQALPGEGEAAGHESAATVVRDLLLELNLEPFMEPLLNEASKIKTSSDGLGGAGREDKRGKKLVSDGVVLGVGQLQLVPEKTMLSLGLKPVQIRKLRERLILRVGAAANTKYQVLAMENKALEQQVFSFVATAI